MADEVKVAEIAADEVENKAWYASKTIWGAAVAVVAGIAGIFGYTVDGAAQADAVNIVVAVGGAVGGALALYGRVKATKAIGK